MTVLSVGRNPVDWHTPEGQNASSSHYKVLLTLQGRAVSGYASDPNAAEDRAEFREG